LFPAPLSCCRTWGSILLDRARGQMFQTCDAGKKHTKPDAERISFASEAAQQTPQCSPTVCLLTPSPLGWLSGKFIFIVVAGAGNGRATTEKEREPPRISSRIEPRSWLTRREETMYHDSGRIARSCGEIWLPQVRRTLGCRKLHAAKLLDFLHESTRWAKCRYGM